MLPFQLTKDTPYLALSGELWSVFYEYFTEIDRVIKVSTVIVNITRNDIGFASSPPRHAPSY